MIDTAHLVESLRQRGVDLFTGVPDSLLKSMNSYLTRYVDPGEYLITANEGNAVAIAIGHYLATGAPAVVFMQNSGLGNCVNPAMSLADPEIFAIPMLYIIGWRGQPGSVDEPQHLKQGRITQEMLRVMEIPHWVVGPEAAIDEILDQAWGTMLARNCPVALLVKMDAISEVGELATSQPNAWPVGLSPLCREAAIGQILEALHPDDVVVATTGKCARELAELRTSRGEPQNDFLTVGGMGHTASIAFGIALARPARRVVCLDGDGSILMHMGAAAIIGSRKPGNFVHVLLNNQSHESVGGQPTVAGQMDFAEIARGCGYKAFRQARSLEEIVEIFSSLLPGDGPVLIEILLCIGSRKNLGRPQASPQQNKLAVMAHLKARA
jgi:phosphonopyruvate decarboxylase